jgi:hypothetical protein
MLRRRRDTPAARRRAPEPDGWRPPPEPGGGQPRPQWRQPPETTAEPVPLRRPYIPPDAFPAQDLTPPAPSRPLPRRRPAGPGQPPAGGAGLPSVAAWRRQPAPGPGMRQAPAAGRRQAVPTTGGPQPAPTAGGRQAAPTAARREPGPGAGMPQATPGAGGRQAAPTAAGREPAPGMGMPQATPGAGMPQAAPGPAMRQAAPAMPQPAAPGRQAPAPAMRRWRPMRAIIGDEFRTPILWCEFGSCIARYTDEEALGEHELRARAVAVGWRYDRFGRLACPACTRRDPSFSAGRRPSPATDEAPAHWSPPRPPRRLTRRRPRGRSYRGGLAGRNGRDATPAGCNSGPY